MPSIHQSMIHRFLPEPLVPCYHCEAFWLVHGWSLCRKHGWTVDKKQNFFNWDCLKHFWNCTRQMGGNMADSKTTWAYFYRSFQKRCTKYVLKNLYKKGIKWWAWFMFFCMFFWPHLLCLETQISIPCVPTYSLNSFAFKIVTSGSNLH